MVDDHLDCGVRVLYLQCPRAVVEGSDCEGVEVVREKETPQSARRGKAGKKKSPRASGRQLDITQMFSKG